MAKKVITEEMLKKWLDVFYPSGYGSSRKDRKFTEQWFIGWLKVGGASLLDYPCEINLDNGGTAIVFQWWHNGSTEYSDGEVAAYIIGVMAVLDPDLASRYRSDDKSLLLLEYEGMND